MIAIPPKKEPKRISPEPEEAEMEGIPEVPEVLHPFETGMKSDEALHPFGLHTEPDQMAQEYHEKLEEGLMGGEQD